MARLDFRHPHLLRNDVEYEAALTEVEELMAADAAPGTPRYERLEFLSVLVEQYEDEEFPMDAPSTQAVVEFALEQKGLERSDLYDVMGGKSRVSEFFAGKRELSMNQVRALREVLGIPADLLI
jgi:HTH-type transcriptional regulator / antitoxin HigA